MIKRLIGISLFVIFLINNSSLSAQDTLRAEKEIVGTWYMYSGVGTYTVTYIPASSRLVETLSDPFKKTGSVFEQNHLFQQHSWSFCGTTVPGKEYPDHSRGRWNMTKTDDGLQLSIVYSAEDRSDYEVLLLTSERMILALKH